MAYQPLFWDSFANCKENHKRDTVLIERLEKMVNRVIENPYHSQSHLLDKKGGIDLRGKRSIHFASHYCIIYLFCEDCIKNGFKQKGFNNCYFCSAMPHNSIIFLAFSHHDNIYAYQWGIPNYKI